jgi:hypothetical protein
VIDLYRERAILTSHLSKIYPSTIFPSDADEPEWNVLTVMGPTGQMTWHISPDDMDLYGHVERRHVLWDGHTTEEKYERMVAINGT